MNIMKTNMLLLDNRIRKDDGDKTTTVAAPVPSTVQPQTGMKALMFQGMQNLMANPGLAMNVGVMKEDVANENTAKPQAASSNISFQGKKTIAMSVLMALAAMGLTSCNDKEVITVPPATYENNVVVNVDLSAVTALVTMMQTTLTQMLLQQQLSYEQFNKYMEQMAQWQNQMNQRFANLEAILKDMGDNIIDIENGVSENNALQQMIIQLLVRNGMSQDAANMLLMKLIQEVKDGKKTIEQAMQEILEQLNLVNNNLSTIIANQDRAYEQQKEVISILKSIKGDTQEMKDAVRLANTQLTDINNTIIDGNRQVVSSISQLDADLQAGIAYIAQVVGWSTSEVIAYMNKLGIDITNSNAWNAAMIIAAINYNTEVTQQGNQTLAELKAKFEAGLITAEQYANEMLNVLNSINAKVGTLIQDFNSYASNMQSAVRAALAELRMGNITAARANMLLVEVLKNQNKAYAMLEIMNQNIEQIDVDMDAGLDALAAKLGCSTTQIVNTLKWLGYSDAKIAGMNTAAIINAIKNARFDLGDKLNAILNKIGDGNNALTQEEIDTIIALLQSIDQGVENNGNALDDIKAMFKTLLDKIDAYAQAALGYFNDYSKVLAEIKAEIANLGNKVNILIQKANTAEEQRAQMLEEIKNIKAQINQIIAQKPITPQELNEMLDYYTKELIAKLQINPADYSTIEELLADIDAKMEYQAQSNKILLEILEAVKNLDKTAPDYNDKLNEIIELMKNFKFECNCKCDCDNNETIHEGVIDIIS